MNLGQRIIKELREFNRKLRRGEPIDATRVERCKDCPGPNCRLCNGKGFHRTRITL